MKREWLIKIRKSKGLTQQQTAQAAFIDRGYYSQIENGKRNPRHQVATSIANVLNFDPLMFLQDEQLINSNKYNNFIQISQQLAIMTKGSLLYMYDDEDFYMDNLITFVLTGIQQKSPCILIVNNKVHQKIIEQLDAVLSTKESIAFISIIQKEEIEGIQINKLCLRFQVLLSNFDKLNSIRVWLSEENTDCSLVLLKCLQELYESNSQNLLFIHSFNGKMISAGEHINMMRKYSYLMTDLEIVTSPLYIRNNLQISPSLYKRGNY